MKLMDISTIRSNLNENKNTKITDLFGMKLNETMPIKPVETDWKNTGRAIEKTFYFSKAKNMKLFVEKLIIKMEKMYHHCEFSVYEYDVRVNLSTKNVNNITQQDTDLAKYLDEIYIDIEG